MCARAGNSLDTLDSRTVGQGRSGAMRERMPQVTEWIDDLRAAFGADQVNGVIREGMRGRRCFWASENGNELGTWWPAIGERDDGTQGSGRS